MRKFLEHRNIVHGGGNTWCTDCGKQWDYGDVDFPECIEISSKPRDKKTSESVALIGFLAAQLAAYEPENETVKRALEYLKNV